MLIITKAFLAIMVTFIVAAITGLILVPILRRMKVKQSVSVYLDKNHQSKKGTPTMGGLIFIIPTLLTIFYLFITGSMDLNYNVLIIIFVFVGYALIGFLDDYLIIKHEDNSKGLKPIQKIILQIIIATVFFFLFMESGNDLILNIHTLGININLGYAYFFFILLVLLAGSNSVNITDGLDGLAGGLSLIAFISFGLISWNSEWVTGYQEIAIFSFVLVGGLLGFLLFNTYPARVFMGDTGSLCLGATLASIAIITSHEVTLIIVAGVFVLVTLSVILQIISIKMFGKKLFLISPIHHHLEKMGWHETIIVKVFWSIGLIFGMLGIIFGVWL